MRKFLNYFLFAGVVLVVIGMALNHSRRMRALVADMSGGNPAAASAAADTLIKSEQFADAIAGETPETRAKAAAALETLGTPGAVKADLNLLKDTDAGVRARALETLKHIGAASPDHIKELVAGLHSGEASIRKGTVAALTESDGIGPKPGVVEAVVGKIKKEGGARGPGGDVLGSLLFRSRGANDASVPALVALLSEKDEALRVGAVEALGKTGDPRAVSPLLKAMNEDTAQVKRVAIGSLALIAHPTCEAALVAAVTNPDDDNEARAQAAAGLGRLASTNAIATLLKALNDDDLKLRSASVAALARAARPKPDAPLNFNALNALLGALNRPEIPVRVGAVQSLAVLDTPEANVTLLATAKDKAPEVRAEAVAALGFSGNAPAVAPLVAALNDSDERVNTAARDALSRIGPAAIPALVKLLEHDGPEALAAAQSLAVQGTAALPALEKAASSSPVARRWAAVALGQTGLAEARPLLERLEKNANPDVAYVAREQLDRLGRTP